MHSAYLCRHPALAHATAHAARPGSTVGRVDRRRPACRAGTRREHEIVGALRPSPPGAAGHAATTDDDPIAGVEGTAEGAKLDRSPQSRQEREVGFRSAVAHITLPKSRIADLPGRRTTVTVELPPSTIAYMHALRIAKEKAKRANDIMLCRAPLLTGIRLKLQFRLFESNAAPRRASADRP